MHDSSTTLPATLFLLTVAASLTGGTGWAGPPEIGNLTPVTTTADPVAFPQTSEVRPIDLDTALRLAGVRNPELLIARERVAEAVALRQFAAAQILPSLNAGTSYDDHNGNLQQSAGNILSVHRQALYLGAGAAAVGAGTVNIPGVVWNMQLSEGLYACLISRQVVVQRCFAEEATRNNVLLRVALAYEELLRAEEARVIAIKDRDEAQEVARLTAAYAKTGQGRKADADRAATEFSRRQYDVQETEGNILTASAKLCQLLNLDPSVRLHAIDSAVVPATIVPQEIPLRELIATAMVRRPELKERQTVIREALLALDGARVLPFTPTVFLGFSAGTFGAGTITAPSELSRFGGRSDFDVVAYWTLRNLGVGNCALIKEAASRVRSSEYQCMRVLDQVRDEVAEAYARARTRFAQVATSEQAVLVAQDAFKEDLTRIKGREGLPIEVLDSLRLLARARNDYLNAIVDYNRAQFELYVALGQPPANALARPAPEEELAAPTPEPPQK